MSGDKRSPLDDAVDIEALAQAYVEKIDHDLAAYGHKPGDPIPDEALDVFDESMRAGFEQGYPMHGRSVRSVRADLDFTFNEMKKRAREIISQRNTIPGRANRERPS